MLPQLFSTRMPQCVSIIRLDREMDAWVSRNKSNHILVFPWRDGEQLSWRTRVCYALTEPQPCGDWCLCIHCAGCHGDMVHFHQSYLVNGLAVRWKHFRSSRYYYEISLLLGWCYIFSPEFLVRCCLKMWITDHEHQILVWYFGTLSWGRRFV